jgi:hypothetical protein
VSESEIRQLADKFARWEREWEQMDGMKPGLYWFFAVRVLEGEP